MQKITLAILMLFSFYAATSQNPRLLKDVYPGATGSSIGQIVKTTGYTFFNAEDDDPDPDRGLYRTDGTAAGTIKLNLTYPTYLSTKAERLTPLGNKVIFAGDNAANYGEIWASDGTQAGTVALERFQPINNKIPVVEIRTMGSYSFYIVIDKSPIDNLNHAYLRKTDGTAGGTSMVYDFSEFTGLPEVVFLTPVNNILYFIVYDVGGTGVDQLWRSDGTTAGTYMVYNFTTANFVESFIMPAGNSMYIMIASNSGGIRQNTIWKSDGTAAGTVPVKLVGTGNTNTYPPFAAIGNTLYFAGVDGNGKELWQTDGTAAGTYLVADISPGAASSNPLSLTALDNQLLFSANNGTNGGELWKYSAGNAVMVKDINPGIAGSGPGQLTVSGNTIIFNANDGTNGGELWITDGTTSNTVLVADINPGAGNSVPNAFTPGNPVYFAANNGSNGFEFFRYDNDGDVLAGSRKFYVNDNSLSGDVLTTGVGNNGNNGSKQYPFSTINYAISIAQAGDTIYVDAGAYAERIFVNKPLTIRGAYKGTNPGALLSRGASESILLPATENNLSEIITIQAADVSIDGFLFDGDNPAIAGSITLNGVDVNAGMGIYNGNLQTDRLVIKNNIFKNFYRYGMLIQKGSGTPLSAVEVSANHIDNISSRTGREGRAVGLFANIYGLFTNNTLTRVFNGFFIANYSQGSSETLNINGNTIETYNFGIYSPNNYSFTSDVNFNNNHVSLADLASWNAPGSSTVNNSIGIYLSLNTTGALSLANNTVNGNFNGVFIGSTETPQSIHINGGSVSNCPGVGVFYNAGAINNAKLKLSNVSLLNNDVGIDASYVTGSALPLEFINSTITGGTIGLRLYGNQVALPGNVLSGVSFTGQTGKYIMLTNHTFNGQIIDATSVSFDGLTGAAMTLAQRFATEDKIIHQVDYDGGGFIQIKAGEVNLTPSSFISTLPVSWGTPTTTPDLLRAISCSVNGDIVNVAAGNYTSDNFTLSKSISILGPNDAINPNDAGDPLLPNAARNPEATITGTTITIGASNISFKGFSFSPGTLSQFVQTNGGIGFDNIDISKNIFHVNSGATVINFTGKQQFPLVTSNYSVSTNRFIKYVGNLGNNISLGAIDGIQLSGNTFTVDNSTANWTQNDYVGGGFRNNNFTIGSNSSYRQRFMFQALNSNNAQVSFNKANECVRFILDFNGLNTPSVIDITDNDVTVANANGGPVISYARSGGTDLSTPNIARIERNTVSANGTGWTILPQTLIAPTVDNLSLNTEVYVRNNVLNISGDFSSQVDPDLYVSGIRFLNNSRKAVVENNDINFTGTNYGTNNKNGIGTVNSGILPDAVYEFRNNKISGFPTSVAIQNDGLPGNLPAGVTININNNSFTGDLISINNGNTGQSANASCNWYGTAAAQSVITKVTPATVNYMPWLSTGTDADIATGFQPVAGSCSGTPISIALTSTSNVTCFGVANGAINITVSGGVPNYNFAWTKDNIAFSSNEDLANLAPGTYHVTVTDANSSSSELEVNISEPELLTANASGTNNACFGAASGTATVAVAGGTTPYSYLWSNGATSPNISNLIAGNYIITVTDANGCIAISRYQVTQPTQLTAVVTDNSTACSNIATATASGGIAPYNFVWSNNATGPTISNVPAGTYSVTVTDANNCVVTATITLVARAAFNPSVQTTHVSCYGGNNGMLTVTNVNGTAPYQYSIDGINYQASNVFSNLVAGTYTVYVIDANNCSGFTTKTISQPAAIAITVNNVQGTCFGSNAGSISITVTGGSPGYSYSWTGPNGFTATSKNISGLAAGAYNLTVTDSKGCTASVLSVIVTSTTEITVTPAVVHIACKGETNGSISLNVSGGSGSGFTYAWSNAATTSSINNLASGNYTVTITDIGSGCIVTKSYGITQPASAVSLSTSKTNATGCASMGTITATGSGGTGGYMYRLNAGDYQPLGLFTNLNGGDYTVWVKDANNCTKTTVVTIGDNGTDEYENNNNKNQSKTITIASIVYARIAVNTDIDWFEFTTPPGTTIYTLSLTHPNASFVFDMYPSGNNAPALVPSGTTSSTKTYSLSGNTTYYIQVSGGTSYTCYNLSVMPPTGFTQTITSTEKASAETTPASISKPVAPAKASLNLSASSFPNPHRGSFTIMITSPEAGNANIELFTVNGQKLQEKTVSLQKGESNTVGFTVGQHGTIFYRIVVGKNVITGKIIGID